MEFKFRAVDDRPPPRPPIFNSSDQPLLGGPFPFGDFRPFGGLSRNPNEFRGVTTVLGLERERLREEIIKAQIARLRELEMEVRREIMLLERLIATRREFSSEELLFEDRWARMRYSCPRVPMVNYFDEHLASSSHPTAFDGIAPEINSTTSEPNKDTLIVLAKPHANLFGVKRKAVTPPTVDANEPHPFGLKKKPKQEWSCALCQVTATSERGLNHHLQGKKHKAREAGLVPKNPSQPTEIGSAANSKLEAVGEEKPTVQNESGNGLNKEKEDLTSELELRVEEKPLEDLTSELELEVEEKPLVQNESGNGLNQEKEDLTPEVELEVEDKPLVQNESGNGLNQEKEDLTSEMELVIQLDKNTGDLDKINGLQTVQTADGNTELETTEKKAERYRFWCETCQVGTQSSKVMEGHKRGKKHTAKAVVKKPKDPNIEKSKRTRRLKRRAQLVINRIQRRRLSQLAKCFPQSNQVWGF